MLQQRDRIKELNSSKKTAESERTKLRAILKKIPIEGTVKPEYEAPYNTARDNNVGLNLLTFLVFRKREQNAEFCPKANTSLFKNRKASGKIRKR